MSRDKINMVRIPYEIVEIKVWDLTNLLVDKNFDEQFEILDRIDTWLAACGWTEREFRYETLKRIDRDWCNPNLN